MGLLVVRETPEQAQALAVPGAVQADLLEAAALVPLHPQRIDDPRTVASLRVRIDGLAGLDRRGPRRRGPDRDATARSSCGTRATCAPGPAPADLERYLRAETFLESDAPEIRAEAEKATVGADDAAPARRAAGAPRPRDPREAADRQPALGARGAARPASATATSTPRSTWRWRARSGCPRGSRSGSCTCAAPSTTTPGRRSGSTEAAGRGRLAPRRPDAQPVPGRRHPRAARARRARQAGRDRRPRRPREARHPRAWSCGRAPSRCWSAREAADLAPLALDIPAPREPGARGCWSQPRR